MKRLGFILLIGFVLVELVLTFFFFRALAQAQGSNTVGLSIKTNDKLEVIAYPVLSPAIYFRVEGVRPEKGLLLCTQVNDTEVSPGGTSYPVVRLNCGKTVLTISGIAFQ